MINKSVLLCIAFFSGFSAQAETQDFIRQTLTKGQTMKSENGKYGFIFRENNDLCIYELSTQSSSDMNPVWCSGKPQKLRKLGLAEEDASLTSFGLSSKGEFGFYETCPAQKNLLPFSFKVTFGNYPSASKFVLGNDGILRVYNKAGKVLWMSGDSQHFQSLNEVEDWSECSYAEPRQSPSLVNQPSVYPLPPKQFGYYYKKYINVDGFINLLGTTTVEDRTMQIVAKQYHLMLQAVKSPADKQKLQGLTVVVMSQYDKPTELGLFYYPYEPDNVKDWLKEMETNYRGSEFPGAGKNAVVLITEEMVCRTGVVTRGDKDTTYRGLDQVVHEVGHAFDYILGFDQHSGLFYAQDGTVISYYGYEDLIQQYDAYAASHWLAPISWGEHNVEAIAYAFQDWFSQDYTAYPASSKKTRTRDEMHPVFYQLLNDFMDTNFQVLTCDGY